MTIEVPDYHRLYVECRAHLAMALALSEHSMSCKRYHFQGYDPQKGFLYGDKWYADYKDVLCTCGLAEAEKFLKENQ